ncbi:hypothetical protein MKW92_029142 [Papaver armeniacum]|nr:hypothetical protein MKW92_029142 [Papaver armeniacum]
MRSLLLLAKVTGGASNKLSRMYKQKLAIRDARTRSFFPLDLRPNKTRTIHRRVTKHQVCDFNHFMFG